MAGALDEQVGESVRQNRLWNLQASWRFVFNSFRVLEERYLKQPLKDLGFKRSWVVDPVAPEVDATVSCDGQAGVKLADLRTWLNLFLEGSIVYAGATTVFMCHPNGDLIVSLRRMPPI
jgi:predicted lipid carrier protein YhbT